MKQLLILVFPLLFFSCQKEERAFRSELIDLGEFTKIAVDQPLKKFINDQEGNLWAYNYAEKQFVQLGPSFES